MTDFPRRLVLATTIPWSARQFLSNQIPFLTRAGWDVHLVTCAGPEVSDLERLEGLTHHEVPMTRALTPFADALSLWRWVSLLRQLRPVAVMSGTPKAGLLGIVSARAVSVPLRVYLVRGLRFEGLRGWRRQVSLLSEFVTCRLATDVVAVSDSVLEEMTTRRLVSPSRIRVLEHGSSEGIDSRHFVPVDDVGRQRARSKLGISPHEFVVGYVGRLTEDKGIPELIGAVRQIRDDGVPARLLIVGGLDGAKPLAAEHRSELSASWVINRGFVDDTSSEYAAMDVVCLPSHREGFPNVILEASSSGVAVVTTNATGCRDAVVDGASGLVVPVQDQVRLADALELMASDQVLRRSMGLAGRELVLKHFDHKVLSAAVHRFLSERVAEVSGDVSERHVPT